MPKLNTKDHLVAVALKTFHAHGYHATSVLDLTTAADVPKGSFYHHFASKEALAAEVVDAYGFNPSRRTVLRDQAIRPTERLRLYFTALNEMYIGKGLVDGCLLGNMSAEMGDSSPLIRARLAAVYAEWSSALADAIRDAQTEQSIVSRESPEALAIFLLDAWEGAVLRSRVEKNRRSLDVFLSVGLGTILGE